MNNMNSFIENAKNASATPEIKKLAAHCLDFTSLNDTDTDDDIRTLCARAITPLGNVAAVCVYARFVNFCTRELANTDIKIATVVNFPNGQDNINDVLADVKAALFDGADEIDVVWPYKAYLQGDRENAMHLVSSIKKLCGDKIVKVILETGELKNPAIIAAASEDALTAGADFLKTSTGKVPVGATLEAAAIMLQAIKNHRSKTLSTLGFKASGGIRTAQDAAHYIQLARSIMGEDWVTPKTFRLGASSLLNNLLDGITTSTGY
jgi:deoxyribose-phosphate aldolase